MAAASMAGSHLQFDGLGPDSAATSCT
jgi:hypothetical protein